MATARLSQSGQGALEYLLLIGGAVLIAAVVLLVVTNVASQGSDDPSRGVEMSRCASYPQNLCTNPNITDFDEDGAPDCQWDSSVGCIPV